ncbi:MAG: N-6 DNA methylase [Actinomycetota bacterium]
MSTSPSAALTRDRRLRSWARALAADSELSAVDLATAVARQVQAAFGTEPSTGTPSPIGQDPPDGWTNPWLPGIVHEQAVSPERRTARGAWYTPRSVVEGLVRLAVPGDQPPPAFVADPTCGGGAFLLAALDHLVAGGVTPTAALASIGGQDIDPDAVVVTGLSIRCWAAANGVRDVDPDTIVTCGDALDRYPDPWPTSGVIVGNPPFGTPLRTGAVADSVTRFREGRENLLGPYADLAAAHLLAAVERATAGATVALVQPQSVLSGRDTEGLRTHCRSRAPLRALWAAREAVFDAGVRACAVVVAPGAETDRPVRLAAGPDVTPVDRGSSVVAGSWSGLAAAALGAPSLPIELTSPTEETGRLGDLITATAGFRDEYYGLVAACGEWTGDDGAEPNRLVTVGSVDPLGSLWGTEPIKFGRRPWHRPTVDLDALDGKVRAWTERQMVPKVVLATQSRVLEPVVDRIGTLIPATPLLAIHADAEDLDRVAAVLLAPPVVAWAWQRWFGSALAVDALKLAARQVAELPLPTDRGAWQEAAAMVAAAPDRQPAAAAWALACAVAEVMNRAYGADDGVYRWWLARARRPAPVDIAAVDAG